MTLTSKQISPDKLLTLINDILDDNKALNHVTIDVRGRSSLTDYVVVVTGSSARHVASMCDNVAKKLKTKGIEPISDGLDQANWVVLDAGDVMVHLMREEVRLYYNIEEAIEAHLVVNATLEH